jgi:hypothetical protein
MKLYPRILGVAVTPNRRVLGVAAAPNPRVMFIILIITLNLHDPSLSGFEWSTRPNSL